MESTKNNLTRTQTSLLTVIAICLCLITIKLYIPEVRAEDSNIIETILTCINGSKIYEFGFYSEFLINTSCRH